MNKQILLNTVEDLIWANSVHKVPKEAKSFILWGNEDAPDKIECYKASIPTIDDKPFLVLFPNGASFAYHLGDNELKACAQYLMADGETIIAPPECFTELVAEIHKVQPRWLARECAIKAVNHEIMLRWLNGEGAP